MSIDFPLILLAVTLFTGVVTLVDWLYCRKYGKTKSMPTIIEYCRAFFPVLLAVLVIRSFLFQPYRVPTGSLEPTVMPGDLILVDQFQYGLNMPVYDSKLVPISEPKTGQIALFYYPVNHAVTFVKRVIGVPGDRISYIDKVFYINGKKMKQTYVGEALDSDGGGQFWPVKVYREDLNGVEHNIYVRPDVPARNFYNLVVPKGHYFMVGDNRDNSDDSRYWGFVPEEDFIGRALYVWFSWDSEATFPNKVRWGRIGNKLYGNTH